MNDDKLKNILVANNIEPNKVHIYILEQAMKGDDWQHHYGDNIVLTTEYASIPENTAHHAIAKNKNGETVWGFRAK